MPQNCHVVVHDGKKHFSRQILAIGRRQIDRAALGRVVDDMHHEPHEPINEVFPSPGFPVQTTIQETAIDFR
jgi:hypothetical protein